MVTLKCRRVQAFRRPALRQDYADGGDKYDWVQRGREGDIWLERVDRKAIS